MKKLLPWLLYLWMAATVIGAFLYAPLGAGFVGKSSRILFFHVPMAWTSFVAFMAAGVWSLLYLWRKRPGHDRAAAAAVEGGLVVGVLATLTGALWARIEWGTYWNWDPRQIWVTVALLFYGAYLALRESVPDLQTRRRLAGAYGALGFVMTPFFFFILPRITSFTLHPQPVINASGDVEMDPRMLVVLLSGAFAFMTLFVWMHRLSCRLKELDEAPLSG